MTSLLKIPSRYDVRASRRDGEDSIVSVVCNDHYKSVMLRDGGVFMGVDEIVRLVEEHEGKCH